MLINANLEDALIVKSLDTLVGASCIHYKLSVIPRTLMRKFKEY